ncbi:hypothetical protein Pyn_24437 [Prunus yedoensis var. nudiflora]|uniref:Uncharacterized protein n=1 Tax=Prunus yedoensis var. nudiflora TaxID=2094558 RepID=A0A314ZKY2_PRUYE|nr:hypothetical protein Pyn_24437 [Prunus yedoensis var. nudiflora]
MAVFRIICEGQSTVKEDGNEPDFRTRGANRLPRWLEVTPATGMIKPEQSVEVSIHHEEFHTLEEFVDGIPQNWLCEDTRDKEVILIVNVEGSCSAQTSSHRVRVLFLGQDNLHCHKVQHLQKRILEQVILESRRGENLVCNLILYKHQRVKVYYIGLVCNYISNNTICSGSRKRWQHHTGFLPSREVFAIHYPGYPSSMSRAIETLGGTQGIRKAHSSQSNRLELHFRHQEPYSHPTFGDLRPCNNLLLKISRTKSNAGQTQPQRMVDYQHVVPVHADGARKKKRNWIEIKDPHSGKIPKRTNWEEYIPQGSDQWESQMAVSQLFDERPVWPKDSLTERLVDKGFNFSDHLLRRLLSRVAYYFHVDHFSGSG